MYVFGKWISLFGVVATAVWFGYELGAKQPFFGSLSTLLVVFGGFLAASWASIKPNPGNPNDVALFRQFLALMPADTIGRFLRNHDFGDDFDRRHAAPIHEFASYWNGPDKRFVDHDLEMSRRRLYEDGARLSLEIARFTVPDRSGDFLTVWPGRHTEMERPPHIWAEIKKLNQAAADFSDTYDRFIEFARTKLHVS